MRIVYDVVVSFPAMQLCTKNLACISPDWHRSTALDTSSVKIAGIIRRSSASKSFGRMSLMTGERVCLLRLGCSMVSPRMIL